MNSSRRAQLFREVNDRICELLLSAGAEPRAEFLCECGAECGQRVPLVPEAYAALRRRGGAVVAAGCAGARAAAA